MIIEWCDFHKAGGEVGLDCWGAGLDGQDSCDKTTRPMRLVPADVTLYRATDDKIGRDVIESIVMNGWLEAI